MLFRCYSSEALSAQSVLESVEDIASADETPVSELAQKLMNDWSSLREAYRIPRKERIQQMKKHEQEAGEIFLNIFREDLISYRILSFNRSFAGFQLFHFCYTDQTLPKHRPKRLPVYAEQMRDR